MNPESLDSCDVAVGIVVSPSNAVPADVPKPGKVTFAVFAVMALACPDVMPVLAVLAVMADAWPDVIPVFAVFAVIALAWPEVMPVFAVLAVIAEA